MTAIESDATHPASAASSSGGFIERTFSTSGLDLASQVMAIRSATRGEREENIRGEMNDAATNRQAQVEARLRALADAAEARESAGLWGEIGTICKVVAGVVSAVAGVAGAVFTGGASLVAAVAVIAALTAAAYALPYVASAVGEALGADAKTMMYIQLAVVAACMVLSIVCPGASASSAAKLVDLAAEMAAGGATLVEANYDLEAGQADASAERHRAGQVEAQLVVGNGLERLQDVFDEALRTSRAVMRMAETQRATEQAAIRV